MTAANLAKRRAAHMERIKQRWKARYYGLRFRRGFVDSEFEESYERGLIHRRIARHMSQCGQCAALLDAAPPSPRGFAASFGARIVRLLMKCHDLTQTERAIARFPKDRTAIVSARVNGIEARFLVDTGSTRTFITHALASRANIAAMDKEVQTVLFHGALVSMNAARAETIAVQNAKVHNLEIVIYTPKGTPWGKETTGILGMTFLEHFDMRICNGVLELTPLAAKPN